MQNLNKQNFPITTSQQIIHKILYYAPPSYTGSHTQPLLNKFNINQILSILDRNKIQSIDKIYRSKQDGFNLLQFVRFFLNVIEHQEIQTLYLTIALVDFFKHISQSCGQKQRLFFIDITNYICSRILNQRNQQNQIQSKLIPDYRTVIPNFRIKEYLVNPPCIYSSKDQLVYKLSLNKLLVDKTKHQGVVTTCYFSQSLLKVFTLDDLSDSISVYNTSCELVKKIKPHFSKLKKDIVVLSFAYSERQQRIGAVLKDFSLNFWDNSDNFQFEKSISTATHCQQYQTNIWFFQYFNTWVTSDKTGHLYVWNLETQQPERKIKLAFETQVNDLAIIPCINLVAIVQQRKICIQQKNTFYQNNKNGKQQKLDIKRENQHQNSIIYLYDFFKGQIVTKIELGPENRNPHTLQYSQNYEVLLSAGYEKKISIFQINKTFLDTNKKGQLTGHQSLITSFTVVKKSPMVISADDKGKVKVWDIRNYKCVQTLDFRDKTNITKLLDMIDLAKIGVLGTRINFVEFDEKVQIQKRIQTKQKLNPLWVEFDYTAEQLIILTKKDLRIIDLKKGVIKNIFCQFHTQDIEITFFKYFQTLQKFVVGTEKGQSKIFCLKTGKFERKLFDHYGSIVYIEYDQQNKIYITIGQDSNIQIQRHNLHNIQVNNFHTDLNTYDINSFNKRSLRKKDYESVQNLKVNKKVDKFIYNSNQQRQEGQKNDNGLMLLRHIKNNFNGRQITVVAVSVYHGFIAIASVSQKNIYIWDYQFSKLLIEICLPNEIKPSVEITSLAFINGYSILIIGTSEGSAYFINISKTQLHYSLKTIGIYKSDKNQAINHITIDLLIKGFALQQQKFMHCKVYFAHIGGFISIMNLTNSMAELKQQPSVVHRQNFNPERQSRQNFSTQLQKKKYQTYRICLNFDQILFCFPKNNKIKSHLQTETTTFEAHKGNISGLNIMELDCSYLVSIGLDERIKIWQQQCLICDRNINLPLPFKWEIQIKNQQKKKEKIMFALKIIKQIFQKYGNQITINQSKCLKVRKLIDKVKNQIILQANDKQSPSNFMTEPNHQKFQNKTNNNIVLFQDQFTRKDMYYDNFKRFNFNQVAGPTLREIEVKKKLDIIQKQWSLNKEKVEEDKNKLLNIIRIKAHKNQQKEQILQFLQPRNFSIQRNINNRIIQQNPATALYIKNLLNKIQTISSPKPTKKELAEGSSVVLGSKNIKQNCIYFNNSQRFKSPPDYKKKNLKLNEENKLDLCSVPQKLKLQNSSNRGLSNCDTFQKYYTQKQSQWNRSIQTSESVRNKQNYTINQRKSCNGFRNIINQMNNKVKQSKKTRLRENQFNRNQDYDFRNFLVATSDSKRNFKPL